MTNVEWMVWWLGWASGIITIKRWKRKILRIMMGQNIEAIMNEEGMTGYVDEEGITEYVDKKQIRW